jgi:hypothetical protein
VKLATGWSLVCGGVFAACASQGSEPRGEPPFALEARVTLDLALGTDDSVVIGRLRHATRLPDGRIVALDSDRSALIFLDSTGMVVHRAGREGAGPGEFEFPSWLARCSGDSVFVHDPSLSRISVYTSAGRFVRQFTPPLAQPFRLDCNRHGMFAALDASAIPQGPAQPGVEPPDLHGALIVFNADGDSISAIPDLMIGQSRVLGPLASLAIYEDGMIVGSSDSAVFRRFSFTGAEVGRDTFPIARRPLSDSLYNAELDRMAGFGGAAAPMRARIREMLAASPKPATLPFYQQMLRSPDGTVWLVTSISVEPSTILIGRRPDGTVHSLSLPAGFVVFEVGNDYLLGKGSDIDGSERLVMYRIGRTGQ